MANDLATQVQSLQSLRATLGEALYFQGLARLREQFGAERVDALLDHPPTPPRPTGIAVNVSTERGSIQHTPVNVVGHAEHVTLAAPDPAAARRVSDLLAYLLQIHHHCNALPLDKIDKLDTGHTRAMELARVYIALDTTASVAEPAQAEAARTAGRDAEARPLSAVAALARSATGRTMLLGVPGSGKSTLVSYLTYCLAGAALAEAQPARFGAVRDWLSMLPDWPHGILLPVPVILRDLAALPGWGALPRGTVAQIIDLIATRTNEQGCPHAAEVLLAALREGRALLLLDGLDEVVGETVLPRVVEAINDAAKTFPGPILVTCRVLDYQEERLRQVPGFAPFTLADLRPEQIAQFIAAWYAELAASGRRSMSDATAATREMQGAVESRDELRALAQTPLLLTLMAQVHAFRGTLPDARARLYFECIELLLLRWRQARDESDLISRLGLSRFRDGDLLTLMARLGYTAHTRAERDGAKGDAADLSEGMVLEVLSATFATYDERRRSELAGIVLQALARGNGLLLKRGPTTYTFAHRTFQEFLAGYHLKGQRDVLPLCCTHARQIHWHEALLLMVGYQVLGEQEREKPLQLAAKLLASGSPLEQTLAGEVLILVGKERAQSYDAALVAANGLWPQTIRTLRALQSQGCAPAVPAAMRHRAGLALGRLCYGDLKDLAGGSAPPNPDPRLLLAVVGTPLTNSTNWRTALDRHYWCPIASGPFWSGDDREQEELEPATITTPYRIARYPITNADYARFLAANGPDGYDPDQPWWTAEGRTYLLPGGPRFRSDEPEQIRHPRFWSVVRYNNPMQPVVGVSWYEAAAYCRWLTLVGHEQGWLAADQIIRLPIWHEWERAARHSDQRRYPWGDTPPDGERANYQATQLNAPAPIGCFPLGAAASQAQDMVGNVMECTASPWEQWGKGEKDFTPSQRVTLSYTDFGDSTNELCCGARGRDDPYIRIFIRGFRVVQSLALIA
ncbi:MAG: hypothetical protein EI684_07690 [Candidatus Viridilinea halotolerans]|uniref:Sulfatase-modifying factor enzyme-like domain-containing protein n=1 Tax=Candidatus Viridilinea halotolerans TaxID=2491704 RepID=A0A426U2Z1_9CHLR|nr:MAG: hypothetical protein EI684_07690 [Candidatus Viridilinea halotolerans]